MEFTIKFYLCTPDAWLWAAYVGEKPYVRLDFPLLNVEYKV
jgi:hypothetical protein